MPLFECVYFVPSSALAALAAPTPAPAFASAPAAPPAMPPSDRIVGNGANGAATKRGGKKKASSGATTTTRTGGTPLVSGGGHSSSTQQQRVETLLATLLDERGSESARVHAMHEPARALGCACCATTTASDAQATNEDVRIAFTLAERMFARSRRATLADWFVAFVDVVGERGEGTACARVRFEQAIADLEIMGYVMRGGVDKNEQAFVRFASVE